MPHPLSVGLLAGLVLAAAPLAADELTLTVAPTKVALADVPVPVTMPAAHANGAWRDEATGTVMFSQALNPASQSAEVPAILLVPKTATGTPIALTPIKAKPEQLGVEVAVKEAHTAITVGGKPFTTFRTDAPRPYFWPIHSAAGHEVTRSYPMKASVATEAQDHPHHRSMWFSFDRVNGHNYWHETKPEEQDRQVFVRFTEHASGPVFGVLTAQVDWVDEKGNKVCQDERTLRVYNTRDFRLFDFHLTLTASEGELTLEDSKEGLFGIRVAGTMDVEQKAAHKKQPPTWAGGTLVNSNGERNDKAWGKRATWCDYFGPVQEGVIEGIAIFDHPQSFRHPTYWHARTYGLYAANPLGGEHFTRDAKQNGKVTLAKGESLSFSYRVYIHAEDTDAARVADHYAAFAQPPASAVGR